MSEAVEKVVDVKQAMVEEAQASQKKLQEYLGEKAKELAGWLEKEGLRFKHVQQVMVVNGVPQYGEPQIVLEFAPTQQG